MWIQTDLEKEEAVESRKELTTTNSHKNRHTEESVQQNY